MVYCDLCNVKYKVTSLQEAYGRRLLNSSFFHFKSGLRINLLCKLIDWFLYDANLGVLRVNEKYWERLQHCMRCDHGNRYFQKLAS